MNSSIHFETLCINIIILLLFDIIRFSYDISYGSIFSTFVNYIYLFGLLASSTISLENKLSNTFVS